MPGKAASVRKGGDVDGELSGWRRTPSPSAAPANLDRRILAKASSVRDKLRSPSDDFLLARYYVVPTALSSSRANLCHSMANVDACLEQFDAAVHNFARTADINVSQLPTDGPSLAGASKSELNLFRRLVNCGYLQFLQRVFNILGKMSTGSAKDVAENPRMVRIMFFTSTFRVVRSQISVKSKPITELFFRCVSGTTSSTCSGVF